ncbi:MAG: hypothetical protein WCA89_12600, partial [Terracidiphilus sp.]
MTPYENTLHQVCLNQGGHSGVQVHESTEVILFWPDGWTPQWYVESQVSTPAGMVQWLDKAYQTMVGWTDVNPNDHYQRKNGVRNRLCFVCNGKGDFVFGGVLRPYIGLRDGRNPVAGSEDWFGWLCHELAHDFFHEPRLVQDFEPWGDGMCDYSRTNLLMELGMPVASTRFKNSNIQRSDRYGRPAKLLFDYEKQKGIAG